MPFTFNNGDELLPNPAPNLAKSIQKSWSAFAATGNPNNEFIPHCWRFFSDKIILTSDTVDNVSADENDTVIIFSDATKKF